MQLPVDVLGEITKYLLPREKICLSLVNRDFYHHLKDIPRRKDIDRKITMLIELELLTCQLKRKFEFVNNIDQHQYIHFTRKYESDTYIIFADETGDSCIRLDRTNVYAHIDHFWSLRIK